MPGPLSDPGNGSVNKMKSLLLSMLVSLNSEQVCKKAPSLYGKKNGKREMWAPCCDAWY